MVERVALLLWRLKDYYDLLSIALRTQKMNDLLGEGRKSDLTFSALFQVELNS